MPPGHEPIDPTCLIYFLKALASWLRGRVGARGLWLLTPPTLPGNTLPVRGAQLLSAIFRYTPPETENIYILYTYKNTE